MASGRHVAPKPARARRHRRWPWVVAAVIVVLSMAAGGTAFAAYRYDQQQLGKILDGVTIAGVDVSGMTGEEALAALEDQYAAAFSQELTVEAGGKKWTITPAEMRARASFEEKVDAAVGLSDRYSWTERVWRRLNHRTEDATYDVTTTMDGEMIRAFVAKVSGAVGQAPSNGGLRLSNGSIQFVKSQAGRELHGAKALAKVRAALRDAESTVKLPVVKIRPEDTGTETKTIVVDLSDNRLYLYEGKKVVDKYSVATGAPGFPTPDGSFQLIEMRKNPTWVNPDPNGWGSSMPASIPPGPGNPLGTRAMNLNAPGIRIHGTSDIGSLGTAASHGCIRMAMPEVEDLFNKVGVGTAVLIKR